MEKYQEKFIERTQKHIDKVNEYAHKIGHTYPHHDYDKLQGELFEPYSLSQKYDQGYDTYSALTEEEKKAYDDATIKHITRNPHHPEYWLRDKHVLDDFTRDNPPVNLDCTKMTNEALIEMCCDWCAMSEEFGNTPFEWMDKNVGYIKYDDYDPPVRWKFNNHQYDFIVETLKELWDD